MSASRGKKGAPTKCTLEKAKVLYPEEWIAFRPLDDSDNPEGEVVLHEKERCLFDEELVNRELVDVYVTFAGPPVPEGSDTLF